MTVENKSFTAGKIIVGFKEETNWLIRKLTSGPANLDVISITGMPGSGKTTLAYKVYNDESVCSHFDLRAWCAVDQEYHEKKLLVKLFNQVTGSDLKSSEDIDVADKLRKQLYGKRYLIVLDDMWDTITWDDLTRPFPDVVKGSRIILTTREMKVADPLNLRLLRPEESWELLEKRAFGEESCPDELLEVGKEIAQNGKGLPLVVDLIAGVIAGREKSKSVWLEVRNNLNSFILNSEVDVMKVIELSYDHLPHHLKPCLIYLASFPKDSEVDRDELKKYWRAEGLVEQTEMKSVEEVIDNLISSSLVIAFNGIDLMPRILNIAYDKEYFGPNNFVLVDSKMKRHSCKHHYSLKIDGDEMEDRLSDACHLRDLRLLRVLILEGSFMMVKDSLLNEICMLNHLSLFVDNKGSTWILLPSIWNLVKLRVLGMDACSFFNMDSDTPILIAEDSKLENLRELGNLVLSYSKETENIFKRFPNLQELSFVLKESCDYSIGRYWFPKLDFLTELEFLTVDFESSNSNDSGASVAINWSWDFHFPSNLKTLLLYDIPLTSDSLSTIVRLPNLEELFLTGTIIQGEEWNMGEEDTFENLKLLDLDEVTFSKWEVGEESFPVLEKLELSRLILGMVVEFTRSKNQPPISIWSIQADTVQHSTRVNTSFIYEHTPHIPSSRIFKASIIDSHNLMPKLTPQAIYSIEFVQGNGGAKNINFLWHDASRTSSKVYTQRRDRLVIKSLCGGLVAAWEEGMKLQNHTPVKTTHVKPSPRSQKGRRYSPFSCGGCHCGDGAAPLAMLKALGLSWSPSFCIPYIPYANRIYLQFHNVDVTLRKRRA
ncbi:hypothetical protein CQW23_31368 [Capsicum baccatum]|uniref:NB-ARC domain-containing protein n=1 Tax=Capsicum baccatum TaxID=33114 RepID=A0A2G2V7R4_CAPBA|nr:hypothetical protein CQW23_31368 [Capsicum baccatum]